MAARRRSIRRLFLEPQTAYAMTDAAKLLGMRVRDLQRWIHAGEVEGVNTASGIEVPWDELASFAMERWSQEAIEAALGKDVASVIPELLRLADLEVRIPRMEIVALQRVAVREGKTVDAVVARELLDFVSAHSEWLGGEVVGFSEAFLWPAGAHRSATSNSTAR